MAEIEKIDYYSRAINRLLSQYKDKPRIYSWIKSRAIIWQEIEDNAFEIMVQRALQNNLAVGDLLLKIGKIVGQGPEGQTDDVFNLLIRARIKANRSSGQQEELIEILSILAPGLSIYFRNYYESSYWIYADGPLPTPPYLVAQSFIGKATAGGVKMMFVWTELEADKTMIFDSIYGGVPSVDTQGFSSIYDSTLGGGLAGAIHIEGGISDGK